MLNKKQKSKVMEASVIIGIMSMIFALTIGFTADGPLRPNAFIMGGLIGAYIGFAGLPYLDKKYKPHPWICAFLAAAAAFMWAFNSDTELIWAILSICVCFVFGFFAPRWAKHL